MNTIETIPLSMLPVGKKCEVVCVSSSGNERRRMLDLGLVNGTTVEAVLRSPSGDPVAYYIRGALIALRDSDAQKITVKYLS